MVVGSSTGIFKQLQISVGPLSKNKKINKKNHENALVLESLETLDISLLK